MLKFALMLLGLIVSFILGGPIGVAVFLVVFIILDIIWKIFVISGKALKASANKISENNKKYAFSYSSNFILLMALIYIILLVTLTDFFASHGIEDETSSIFGILSSFAIIYLLSAIYRKYQKNLYKKFLYSIVEEHYSTLFKKYKELVYIGDYGETIYDKWYDEVDHFVENIIQKQQTNFTFPNNVLKERILKIFDELYNKEQLETDKKKIKKTGIEKVHNSIK